MNVLRRRATRAEVSVLALGCAASGVTALALAAVPFSSTAPSGRNAVLGVLALALAAALRVGRSHVPVAVVHLVLGAVTVVVAGSVATATTPVGPGVTAWGLLWVVLYAAALLGRTAVLVHVVGAALGLAVALHLVQAPSAPQTWAFITVTLAGVAAVVHVLVARLREQAHRDPLTGLLTRAAFATAAEQAIARSRRSGSALSLAVIDLDGFKAVNDVHGHAAGDELLVRLAHGWRTGLREQDVLGRHGGDEFVLLMPDTAVGAAREVLQRLQRAVPDGRWTAGVAAWQGQGLQQWLADADRDLYLGKRTTGPGPRSDGPGGRSDRVGGQVGQHG